MSIIDALETENKQALGALKMVTGQRDRLRRLVLAQEQLDYEAEALGTGAVSVLAAGEYRAARADVLAHGDLTEDDR